MSLLESIKADEEALAKLQEAPKEEAVEVKEELAEEPVEEAAAEEAQEEPKEEPKEVKPDASAYAKMRIDKAAAEAKAREAEDKLKAYEERIARLEKASQTAEEEEEASTTVELPQDVQDLVADKKRQAAKEHFGQYEQEFLGSGEVADYDPIIQGYAAAVYKSLALLNPRLPAHQIEKQVETRILQEAAMYHNARLNPAEEMYKRAKSLGIQAPAKQEEQKEEVRKPNLERVAENKKRSAGMASAGGSSNEVTTLQAAVDMPLSQFAAIPAAEIKRLEEAARR